MNNWQYRFTSVRGLERARIGSAVWNNVDGDLMEQMSAKELRHIADVLDRVAE